MFSSLSYLKLQRLQKSFIEEQIIGYLQYAEAGMSVEDMCRRRGFNEVSYYLWRSKFGSMKVSGAKRLEEPEIENGRLKKAAVRAGTREPSDQGRATKC